MEMKNMRKAKTSHKVGPDEASQIIKKYAAKQKIKIKLTEEQLNTIMDQWDEKDPKMPAEITFYAGRRAVANLKVAGYRYRGDTCCV
jgi:cytochrome c551/c552